MIGLILLGLLAVVFATWRAGRRLRFFLHLIQLEGYRPGPLLAWCRSHFFDACLRPSHAAGILILVFLWVGAIGNGLAFGLWAIAFISSRRYRRDRPKKPLAWTSRMRRLGWTAVGIAVMAAAAKVASLAGILGGDFAPAWILAGFLAADLGAPLWVALAAIFMRPVEARVHEGYKRSARARLAARPDLVVIGITGSYGKTSVKFALAEVLRQRYAVLATPGSYNTPMGICTVINRDLKPWHQVLVLEMGIRHPGDLDELVDIARPDIAIITGIGIAHLESMGTREAIAREKGKLFEALPPEGTAILPADDDFADTLAALAPGPVVRVGTEAGDLVASGVAFSMEGTRFQVSDGSGRATEVSTPLLGRHHILNQLLALACGQVLGVRLRAGARGLRRLEPVSHRLSVREEAGVTILDDAFNSNPVGARNALEVLGQFSGRRIVVTPGMIELGDRQEAENRAFGAAMVGKADDAILVGPARTAPIADGLREAGMDEAHIHVVHTLFEARELVARLAAPGDAVLYENDLPDQFTEAAS